MIEKKLPKEYISVSQINQVVNCGYKYKLRYVDNAEPSNEVDINSLLLGNAVHSAIENYFKNEKKDADLNWFILEVCNYIKNGQIKADFSKISAAPFIPETYEGRLEKYEHEYRARCSKSAYLTLKDVLKSILPLHIYNPIFYGTEEELKTKTVIRPSFEVIYSNIYSYFLENVDDFMKDIDLSAVEDEVIEEIEIDDEVIKFKAYIDFKGYTGDFKTVIIDWKTAKKAWPVGDLPKVQDQIYSFLHFLKYGSIPIFRYNVFSYSKDTGVVKHQQIEVMHTIEEMEEIRKEISQSVDCIVSGKFVKNPGSFLCSPSFCEYYDRCQGYKKDVVVRVIS